MPQFQSRARLAAGAAALVFALGAVTPIGAQDATPAAGGSTFPIVPDPAACQVEPRTTDELLALWYSPEGEPMPMATPMGGPEATSLTIPIGPPADAATIAEVESLVAEVFGCFASGEFARATALFSDDLVRGFGAEPGTTPDDVRGFLEASPVPEMEGESGQIISIADVMDLGDGRVGAFVVDDSVGQLDTVYAIFTREDDGLILDELIDFVTYDG